MKKSMKFLALLTTIALLLSGMSVGVFAQQTEGETVVLNEGTVIGATPETPTEEIPDETELTPQPETPGEETPVPETPLEETPVEETPGEQTPAEEPAAEQPSNEEPATEQPSSDGAQEEPVWESNFTDPTGDAIGNISSCSIMTITGSVRTRCL